jgi:glucuronokinase
MSARDTSARGLACARAALAGNPSDGYGGAVLAVTVPALFAEASAIRVHDDGAVDPASDLVEATVQRFARSFSGDAQTTAVRWRTSIPRGVGLGGSSAIVISTLRALCDLYSVRLPPAELASFALEVETEELGIVAGLQDRVAQAHGGLTFMDFGRDRRYEPLPPSLLPPLLIAWRSDAARESGDVHRALRARAERGDGRISEAMAGLAELAREARAALRSGDHKLFAAAVDGSFDLRRRVLALDRRHVEMVERARSLGASANFTGSGGAIVAISDDERHRDEVAAELAKVGCQTLVVEGDSRFSANPSV